MTQIYDRKFGNCYSFNFDGNRMANKAGEATGELQCRWAFEIRTWWSIAGLEVRVKTLRDSYLPVTDSVGMLVAIHEPGVFPFMNVNNSMCPIHPTRDQLQIRGFSVPTALRTSFSLRYSQVLKRGKSCVPRSHRHPSRLLPGNYSVEVRSGGSPLPSLHHSYSRAAWRLVNKRDWAHSAAARIPISRHLTPLLSAAWTEVTQGSLVSGE